MGHQHVPALADTAPWREVIATVAEAADVPVVAAATTKAAIAGLERAKNDSGLPLIIQALSQVVLAARGPDFAESLNKCGVYVSGQPDVLSIVAGFAEAVDKQFHRTGGRTDIGEMAQLAAVETLTNLLSQRSVNLFEITPSEVRAAARSPPTTVLLPLPTSSSAGSRIGFSRTIWAASSPTMSAGMAALPIPVSTPPSSSIWRYTATMRPQLCGNTALIGILRPTTREA